MFRNSQLYPQLAAQDSALAVSVLRDLTFLLLALAIVFCPGFLAPRQPVRRQLPER